MTETFLLVHCLEAVPQPLVDTWAGGDSTADHVERENGLDGARCKEIRRAEAHEAIRKITRTVIQNMPASMDEHMRCTGEAFFPPNSPSNQSLVKKAMAP